MKTILEGYKILDVSQVAAVPIASRHLADFGADVIHVERLVTGDSWRGFQARPGRPGGWGNPSDINYIWEDYNRNKRSLALDLGKSGAQEIIYKLVESTDIFLTNLRPFEIEKFGVQYEMLSRINPGLIYGSLTGYGKKGPDKNYPAYDSIAYWARAGVGYVLGTPDAPPVADGTIGDNIAGLALAFGIMLALFHREKTGVGQQIDSSLLHAGVYQMSSYLAGTLITGRDYSEWRNIAREKNPNPLAQSYQTKDGRWILLAAIVPDRYWSKLCQAIEQIELEHDPRFETFELRAANCKTLFYLLENAFKSRTLDEWKARLTEIPFSPFQNFIEVVNDTQARENNCFIPFEHPNYGHIEVVANPVNLSHTPASIRMPAPELGQHTEEILLEHGYTWEDISKLKDQGIIN
jgi:crotonobetainyl-CoA:carnitine CoA-transferase CaiB-like acyl-CoA transferase